MWFIYTMEDYLVIKNKDNKRMELQIIILGKVIETQKDMHSMYSFISGYQKKGTEYSLYILQTPKTEQKEKSV